MIDICTLGTGGSLPMPERALASLYVRMNGHALLVDCGEGTQVQIRKLGWGFRCIDGMLITHYHGDHCSGMAGFLLSLAKAERTETFHIYGPPGLHAVFHGLMVIAPTIPYPIELHELPLDKAAFSMIGLEIESFPLNHGVPCIGYRFALQRRPGFSPEKAKALGVPVSFWKTLQSGEAVSVDGRMIHPEDVQTAARQGLSFLYVTDTRPMESIVAMGFRTDLMILEGMYGDDDKMPQAKKNRHMLFRESAALARDAETKRLLLTHFSTSIEDPMVYLPNAQAVFPETEIAADCATYRLELPRR